jgi:hypothetical protein
LRKNEGGHNSHRSGNLTPITFYTTAKPRAGAGAAVWWFEIGAPETSREKKGDHVTPWGLTTGPSTGLTTGLTTGSNYGSRRWLYETSSSPIVDLCGKSRLRRLKNANQTSLTKAGGAEVVLGPVRPVLGWLEVLTSPDGPGHYQAPRTISGRPGTRESHLISQLSNLKKAPSSLCTCTRLCCSGRQVS